MARYLTAPDKVWFHQGVDVCHNGFGVLEQTVRTLVSTSQACLALSKDVMRRFQVAKLSLRAVANIRNHREKTLSSVSPTYLQHSTIPPVIIVDLRLTLANRYMQRKLETL